MSRDASVTLDWGDDTYTFRLGYGELMQLQESTDAGPLWVLNRMMQPTPENRGWRVQDIAQTIRLGLIGGGMEPAKALRMVRTYVEARPPVENLLFAQAVLMAALMGAADEETQKKSGRKRRASTTSRGASGDSARSLGSAPQ